MAGGLSISISRAKPAAEPELCFVCELGLPMSESRSRLVLLITVCEGKHAVIE